MSNATEPNTTSIDAMVAEIRRQASQRNATWTGIMLSDMLQLCAELDRLREDRDAFRASSDIRGAEVERLRARVAELERALHTAEAALADIGDADREPGDDVAWCERRAADALPSIRSVLSKDGA